MYENRCFRELIETHKMFGAVSTARWIFLKALNRLLNSRFIVGMTLEHVEPAGFKMDARFQAGVMKASDLLHRVGTPGWDHPGFNLSRESLNTLDREGVELFCITDGDRLASIGCYARHGGFTMNDGWPVFFDPGYVYMFRGFTHPDYRGFRLHGVGMALAMQAYQRQGFKGLISDVDARNLSSLKSVYRLGYRKIGLMLLVEPFGKHFIFTGAGCRRYGFRFGQPVPKEMSSTAEPLPAGR